MQETLNKKTIFTTISLTFKVKFQLYFLKNLKAYSFKGREALTAEILVSKQNPLFVFPAFFNKIELKTIYQMSKSHLRYDLLFK